MPSNDYSDIFHMDANVWEDDLNKTFCIKEENSFDGKGGIWPKGERFLFFSSMISNALVCSQ